MKMSEQEVHLIHDLWDVVKSYSSNRDHEILCEELFENPKIIFITRIIP